MTEDTLSLSLLIKLLKMTTASNDGEALAAIRRANAILAKHHADWESLLRGKVTIVADPFTTDLPQPPAARRSTPRAPAPPQDWSQGWTPPSPPRRATPQPPPRPQAPPQPPPDYAAQQRAREAARLNAKLATRRGARSVTPDDLLNTL